MEVCEIKRRTAPVLMTLALLMAGCVPQGAPSGTTESGVEIHSDSRLISSKQWEVYQPDPASAMASVVANARDANISVLCDGKGHLSVQLHSHDGRELKSQSLTVKFDQGVAADYPWNSDTEEGWIFVLLDDDADFATVVADLRRHKSLEAVVSEDGKEWRRYQFTLAKADAAIDYVVKLCGKN